MLMFHLKNNMYSLLQKVIKLLFAMMGVLGGQFHYNNN